MSTRNGFELQQATVHSVDAASGICQVKIPALLSNTIVPIPPTGLPFIDGAWKLPAVGELKMVAVNLERSNFYWVVSADSDAVWDALLLNEINLTELAVSGGTETVNEGTAPTDFDANPSIAYGGLSAVPTFTATLDSSGPAAFAGGMVKAVAANAGIVATGTGAVAQGYAKDGTITSSGYATHAQGYAGNGGTVTASGDSSRAHGDASWGGAILASSVGSVAGGFAANEGTIEASNYGAIAHGYVDGFGHSITASGGGSFAQGYSNEGSIIASADGAFAQGYVYEGPITASGRGSLARGCADYGAITASTFGAHASGETRQTGSAITASGRASFAHGSAYDDAVTASGAGSFAQGYTATGESIVASATNAVQFGPGTNSLADSVKVGDGGLHLFGKAQAAPGTPADGMVWVDLSGDILVRTGGNTKNLSDTATAGNPSYVAKTATYAASGSDYTIDCTSGTFNVTLPTAVGVSGKIYVVKNSGAGVITVDTTSSQTIDGVTTQTVNPTNALQVQSTGANWIII